MCCDLDKVAIFLTNKLSQVQHSATDGTISNTIWIWVKIGYPQIRIIVPAIEF